jgi:hypothetical protein
MKNLFSKFMISDLRNISEVPIRVFCGHGDEPSHIFITTYVVFVLQLYFVNVKLSLSGEGIRGREGIVPGILSLGTR